MANKFGKGIKRTHAKDFGDNPKIRHSHGEHKTINMAQPWEKRYAKKFRRLIKVKPYKRKMPDTPYGKARVKVSGYSRLFRKWKKK